MNWGEFVKQSFKLIFGILLGYMCIWIDYVYTVALTLSPSVSIRTTFYELPNYKVEHVHSYVNLKTTTVKCFRKEFSKQNSKLNLNIHTACSYSLTFSLLGIDQLKRYSYGHGIRFIFDSILCKQKILAKQKQQKLCWRNNKNYVETKNGVPESRTVNSIGEFEYFYFHVETPHIALFRYLKFNFGCAAGVRPIKFLWAKLILNGISRNSKHQHTKPAHVRKRQNKTKLNINKKTNIFRLVFVLFLGRLNIFDFILCISF